MTILSKISKGKMRYFIPIIYCILLALFFVFSLKFGINKILSQKKSITSSEKTVNIMTEKVLVLQQFNTRFGNVYESTMSAFPLKSSLLLVYSEIKRAASENSLFVEDVKLSIQSDSEESESYAKDSVSFTLSGNIDSVINFFDQIHKISPWARINKIELSLSGGEVVAATQLFTFWSIPKAKLTTATNSLSEITNEDMEILSQFKNLQMPLFFLPDPQSPSSRSDPFN